MSRSKSKLGRKIRTVILVFLFLVLVGPAWLILTGEVDLGGDWRTAGRESADIAPLASTHPDALVLVYAARAFKWRGAFAVHTWISAKPRDSEQWTVYQVVGWRKWRGLPVVSRETDLPDRLWYGQKPELLGKVVGDQAQRAIAGIESATDRYPWPMEYRLWPGPNSNTFVSWVAREVPELRVNLPVSAIGKDYLGPGKFLAPAPSNTGYQFSLGGVFGVTIGKIEGFELNFLGSGFGFDFLRPAIKLPGIGRFGKTSAE